MPLPLPQCFVQAIGYYRLLFTCNKLTGYYLKNFQSHLCHCQIKFCTLKALKTLHEKGSFSRDSILMTDEMYLQKSAQYQLGEYVGVDE